MNLGILAHIDAGKTSLTERLLYEGGAISEPGSVDEGNTQTDSMEIERQRGITIKSAVAAFTINDVDVNLIDTPGHPDFIAEVERALALLDGAVIVISAVEGVQAQTRVLFRTLKRLRIPTIFFVNKIDRPGARFESLMTDIAERLTESIIPMSDLKSLGGPEAEAYPRSLRDPSFQMQLAELIADHDEGALEAFVRGSWDIPPEQLGSRIAGQVAAGNLHPVYFGSATRGTGIANLIHGITTYLPTARGDPDGPPSASIFKIERGNKGEKIGYVRVFDGTLPMRYKHEFERDRGGKVTAIQVFKAGGSEPARQISAGQIGKVWGLGEVRIGDTIGTVENAIRHNFSPPTLETLIVPQHATDRGALLAALAQLSEQDPFINVRQDDLRQQVFVSLYGEVQKEVIGETLLREYGLSVEFRQTTVICIERLTGTGSAAEMLRTESNPFLATIGLRVEPRSLGSGNKFALEVELGSIPLAFHRAVEETVSKSLEQGLNGWQVTDCLVTMTHSGYLARQSHSYSAFDKSMSSTAGDFRQLTPLVLMDALKDAGTQVCEPINRFFLEVPTDVLSNIFPLLTRHGAAPGGPIVKPQTAMIEGTIPAAMVHDLQQMLPHVTRGEGSFEASFDHYEPVLENPPSRPRTDNNPLDRTAYLSRLGRRP